MRAVIAQGTIVYNPHFNDGRDLIELKGVAFKDLSITTTGSDIRITFYADPLKAGEGETLTLEGAASATITEADFIF